MGKFRRFFNKIFRRGYESGPVITSSYEGPTASLSQAWLPYQYTPLTFTTVNEPSRIHASASGGLQADEAAQGPYPTVGSYPMAGPSQPPRPGLFQNASNFLMHQPILGEHVEVYQQSSGVFERMRIGYVISGAEFDSSHRNSPPRCHPGTRTRFLDELQSHIRSGMKIIWVRGPAGVGKSAIMQTLVETISPYVTCTTLFFSRPNKRDDPKKVFTTLAYSLVVANSSYRQYLGEKMTIDSGFLDKTIEEQFKRLFVIPFTNNRIDVSSSPWIAFLDGLDECDGEQGRIVDVIRESILHHANSMPFVWIIASRPEAYLSAPFARVEAQISTFRRLEIPIDSDEASQDVERHLRAEFAKIRQNYSDMVPSHWPREKDLLKLAKACSGLFVFASTSMAYIGEDNPVLRFEHILSLITQHKLNSNSKHRAPTRNPFEMLDLLYTTIMSDIPTEFLSTAKTILGFRLLGDLVSRSRGFITFPGNPSFLLMCNILGLEQHMAYAALRRLNSVLTFPSQEAPDDDHVKFLHASFSDFLRDQSRSKSYHVDLDQELEKIWRRYVQITKQSVTSLDDIALSWEHELAEGSSELRRLVLQRAEHKWLEILIDCCHPGQTSNPYDSTNTRQLLPSTSELIEIFQDIRPILFRPSHPDIRRFRNWLSTHAPIALRQKLILKEFDLRQIDKTEVRNMFNGFCTQLWGYYAEAGYSVGLRLKIILEDIDHTQWNEIKRIAQTRDEQSPKIIQNRLTWRILGHLLRVKGLIEANANISVTVIGTHESDYFAVIGSSNVTPVKVENRVLQASHLIIPYVPGSTEKSNSAM